MVHSTEHLKPSTLAAEQSQIFFGDHLEGEFVAPIVDINELASFQNVTTHVPTQPHDHGQLTQHFADRSQIVGLQQTSATVTLPSPSPHHLQAAISSPPIQTTRFAIPVSAGGIHSSGLTTNKVSMPNANQCQSSQPDKSNYFKYDSSRILSDSC